MANFTQPFTVSLSIYRTTVCLTALNTIMFDTNSVLCQHNLNNTHPHWCTHTHQRYIPTSFLLLWAIFFSMFIANIWLRKERLLVFSITCWYGDTALLPITTWPWQILQTCNLANLKVWGCYEQCLSGFGCCLFYMTTTVTKLYYYTNE